MIDYKEATDLYNSARNKEKGKPLHHSTFYLRKSNDDYFIWAKYAEAVILTIHKDDSITFNLEPYDIYQGTQRFIEHNFNCFISKQAQKLKRYDTKYEFMNPLGDTVFYKPGIKLNKHGQFISVPPYTKYLPTVKKNNEFTRKSKIFRQKLVATQSLLPPDIDITHRCNMGEDYYNDNFDKKVSETKTTFINCINKGSFSTDEIIDMCAYISCSQYTWHDEIQPNNFSIRHSKEKKRSLKYKIDKRTLHQEVNKLRDQWLWDNNGMKEMEIHQ